MNPFAFISAHELSQFSGVTDGYPITCQNLPKLALTGTNTWAKLRLLVTHDYRCQPVAK